MASPIGHALAGYAVYCAKPAALQGGDRVLPWLCVALAISPDLDFLPGLLHGQPALYHQGVSHSLGFALGVGLIAAIAFYGRSGVSIARCSLLAAAYASHLIIDLFCPDSRPPYGIPLFWPLSDATVLAPFHLFLGVHHAGHTSAGTSEWLAGILDPYNIGAISVEIAASLALVLVARYLRRRYPATSGTIQRKEI